MNWLIRLFQKTIPEEPAKTIVDVRGLQVPAKYWKAEVHYDAWGHPYIIGGYYQDFTKHQLHVDGRVSETGKVEWKHCSGPPVTFGDSKAHYYGWRPRR